ncbi:hypothetical protein like AT5G25950 [Hibiscus trionum]|uniref:Neprosin PEP catalytic domain-containing protein n=1 Tax=Hibiscus trionum TaxID=183268 RepID=A0A9W7I3V7_HIBTR|nr:hypothetical protein like AT5G25950 [Hibiscus trionum]
MGKLNVSMLFLTLVLSYLSDRANGKINFKELVDAKLKQLNKPAVKTIQSEDGDIIDCVDIYKQPAFDNPALKNHTIQMKPSFNLKEDKSRTVNGSAKLVESQTWQRSGSCPELTIPIRRIQRKDLLRADSIDRFGRIPQETVSKSNTTNQKDGRFLFINNTKIVLPTVENESAAMLVTLGPDYIGAKGDINVWNPSLSFPDHEFSTAQIWVKSGPADVYESLESGWAVFPNLYGDKKARLFVRWSANSSIYSGCFDLLCDGFIQTNHQVALGAAVEPVSSVSGQQYYITIGIYKDPQTNNWWLKYGDDTPIGYWPGSLFSFLTHSSKLVEWGGRVYSTNVKKSPHTKAGMGSGHFASGLFGKACFIRNVAVVDFSMQLKYPQWVGTWDDEFNCYTVYNDKKSSATSPAFYFGGPGQNPQCP